MRRRVIAMLALAAAVQGCQGTQEGGAGSLDAGECFTLPGGGTLTPSTPVEPTGCQEPHTHQVLDRITVMGARSAAQRSDAARSICRDIALNATGGRPLPQGTSIETVLASTRSAAQEQDALCILVHTNPRRGRL